MKKTLAEFKKKIALKLFGREPKFGECVRCGVKVNIFEFEKDIEQDEYLISYFCTKCQRETFNDKDV
jgi:hypothetical protein